MSLLATSVALLLLASCMHLTAGSVMSSNIGKLMVDMFMESAQYIEVSSHPNLCSQSDTSSSLPPPPPPLPYPQQDIIQFFSIFVKLKDVTTSKAFKVSETIVCQLCVCVPVVCVCQL